MSIHTQPAIKLEKQELGEGGREGGREAELVDAQQIYITAEAAREESMREGERNE